MCGIAGFLGPPDSAQEIALRLMADKIKHRGPDGSGIWINNDHSLGLAHQRLSILDLSDAGAQPMHSKCLRYTIVYNGEIYNHLDLRKKLEIDFNGLLWESNCDTETLFYCLIFYGIDKTLNLVDGMFAFAFWDNLEKKLFIARDRVGEKPLYYCKFNNFFIFSSELQSLCMHPEVKTEIDNNSFYDYLNLNYVPCPKSIYKNIFKLEPGKYLTISENSKHLEKRVYWDLKNIFKEESNLSNLTLEEHCNFVENILKDSIKKRMLNSDVPIGCFLSGGIDSSTIASLMQEISSNSINTFSIGSSESEYDEAKFAMEISKHLGTSHHELYLSPKEIIDVLDDMPDIYDEPFADISQIPTYILCQFARKSIKVALSGDGGDELFCGYNRHLYGAKLWELVSNIPYKLRSNLKSPIDMVTSEKSINLLRNFGFINNKISNLGNKLDKFSNAVGSKDNISYYKSIISKKRFSDLVVSNEIKDQFLNTIDKQMIKTTNIRNIMMFLDQKFYLPDDILVKVDRASMYCGLETRIPFLSHKLIEYTWQIPLDMKYKGINGKIPLKKILYKYVPKSLLERPKQGFGLPIDSWLKGPLKDWSFNLIFQENSMNHGLFNKKNLIKLWDEHQSGKKRNHNELWTILMFNLWYKKWHF
ncbi:asparagine synthase (glutamine-hydrolyzing) [Prochlorococcus marinus XMU1414]|uniref:asparagine synthase (glutamine-hydrolyzing) n=1 Tax=Prochlorococcus marinus XMU1424 TaxID=2774497 RepID=A0A9D9BXC9_PROMR|nr:asparagine synthase (glutamine-hydrolyzing) [Prochlorococcus marinus]MBO8228677.1 asparagine synthase (glutamine-hydrolyzing) [Prochlorococcus marinus XMU1414]MBW3046156.1 asparagine synthase (glutamine-hydrolyzing) [Prochlorococcus marinus str. MU1414]MCR8531552.1 asparagine synthase (glutamine-hydrolyzing) [Prochlorococcus marinus XMU1420]MCR8535281.1 asparagine synthase (glutamine-hydrolyzing) [Prochlorococcus marinus XMU1424]